MRRLLCLMVTIFMLVSSVSAYSAMDYFEPVYEEVYSEVSVLADAQPYASYAPSYSVGTTNLSIFQAVAEKLPYGTHYVYWREGQYEYCLAYSPTLELAGSTFTGQDVTVVSYSTYTGSSQQTTFTTGTAGDFSLSALSYLVWSDLGDYPTLYARGGADYAQTACIILCSFALYYLFHHMWGDIRQRYLGR